MLIEIIFLFILSFIIYLLIFFLILLEFFRYLKNLLTTFWFSHQNSQLMLNLIFLCCLIYLWFNFYFAKSFFCFIDTLRSFKKWYQVHINLKVLIGILIRLIRDSDWFIIVSILDFVFCKSYQSLNPLLQIQIIMTLIITRFAVRPNFCPVMQNL